MLQYVAAQVRRKQPAHLYSGNMYMHMEMRVCVSVCSYICILATGSHCVFSNLCACVSAGVCIAWWVLQ